MYKHYICCLLIGLFSIVAKADPALFFRPNFHNSPTFVSRGTPIVPLCSTPQYYKLCIDQWAQQGVPLHTFLSQDDQMVRDYYLPAFIVNQNLTDNLSDETDWDIWNPNISSNTQRYFRNKKNPNQIRRVTKNSGQTQTQEGAIQLVNARDISLKNNAFEIQTDTMALPATESVQDSKKDQTQSAESPEDSKTDTESTDGTLASPDTGSADSTNEPSEQKCYILNEDTQTEADFCANCSYQWSQQLLSKIVDVLKKVERITKTKISAAQSASKRTRIEKICEPDTSLKGIINNFNKHCEPHKFETFFKQLYCASCKQGIPPEVMTSMMSIESSGKCSAENNTDSEHSMGLFQINASVHPCDSNHQRSTPQNAKCLKDISNNMNKSISILRDSYQLANSSTPSSQCTSWEKLTSVEKNRWRKGVSAYNGGPKWVKRAMKSAKEARNVRPSWEELRIFYFIEKLTKGSGRTLDNSISNLAHTESVLGRNVGRSSASMVEIWTQYKIDFLKRNPISCD